MKGSISPRNVNEIALSEILNSIDENFQTKEQVNILEIGSGAGAFIQHLKSELDNKNINYNIEAGDIEPHQINDQNLSFKCNFLDAQTEFVLDKKYDIIISIELIEHIENPFHFIREISKNLAENGVVLLTSPNILSLRSRLRYLLTGCTDYFRRPYNEYWLNMGHVNPINPLQLIYILRKNGFSVKKVISNNAAFESLLLIPIIPFIWLFSSVHYLLREKGKEQKKRNRELMGLVLSPRMLLGKTAIYKAVKEKSFIAERDIWFQGDDNFLP